MLQACEVFNGTGLFLNVVDTVHITCFDRDECLEGASCPDPNSWCNNTIGAYQCFCNKGYTDRGAGNGFKCWDIDECSPLNPCDPPGSYHDYA